MSGYTSPAEGSIDWDHEVDSYRSTSSRQSSLQQMFTATITQPKHAPSPFHRNTTASNTGTGTGAGVSGGISVAGGCPNNKLPPPVPSQFKRPISPASPGAVPPTPSSAPPLTSHPPAILATGPGLAPVMNELKAVYNPFPAYNPSPAPHGALLHREPIRVVVTGKHRRTVTTAPMAKTPQSGKRFEEQKQMSPLTAHSVSNVQPAPSPLSAPASGRFTVVGSHNQFARAQSLPAPHDESKRYGDEYDNEDTVNDDNHSVISDDDIDDEDESRRFARSWLEFVEPNSGQKLYHNLMTGETSWERPHTFLSQSSPSPSVSHRGRMSSSIETNVANADDLSDIVSLPSITPARVSQALHSIDRAYESMIHKGVNLPLSIIQALTQQRQALTETIQSLDVVVHNTTQNEVEALIGYDNLPWNFSASVSDSVSVDMYRAQAATVDHSAANDVDWATPQFFSSTPISLLAKSYSMTVRLPAMDSDGEYVTGANSASFIPRYVHLTFNDRDTAQSLIRQALSKGQIKHSAHSHLLSDAQSPMNDWAMKCVGSETFAYSDRSIMDYEFIRSAIRQHEDIQVVIVKRSHLKQSQLTMEASVNSQLPELYHGKVNATITPIDTTHYRSDSSNDSTQWMNQQWISVYDNHFPLRFRILGLDHLNEQTITRLDHHHYTAFHVKSFFFHGCHKIEGSERLTQEFAYLSQPRFHTAFSFPQLTISTVPRELRVAFVLYGRKADDPNNLTMLAYVSQSLVDERGLVQQGRRTYRMWPVTSNKGKKHGKDKDNHSSVNNESTIYQSCPVQNHSERESLTISVRWEEWALPLVYPLYQPPSLANSNNRAASLIPNKTVQKQLDELLSKDALYPYAITDLAMIHTHRHHLMKVPHALPLYLLSVNWMSVEARYEAYELLTGWSPPYNPINAMMLLDAKYSDSRVRHYAITILRRLSDDELSLYLLQLVQCLKYEQFHYSALSQFLVERGTMSPISIGVPLFWHLKCELHVSPTCERYTLIAEELLSFSPRLTQELHKQNLVITQLQRVSELVQRWTRDVSGLYTDLDIGTEYTKEMHKLNEELLAPINGFRSPLHPKVRVTTLCVEKCRYMSSKMVPLWLVFNNADPYVKTSSNTTASNSGRTSGHMNSHSHTHSRSHNRQQSSASLTLATMNLSDSRSTVSIGPVISAPKQASHPKEFIFMIFKSGDDLRQDILTLQLLRLMDSLWLSHSLDLRLHPYQVVATGVNEHGDGIGLIEVVMNSDTTSRIQVKYGGKALGALNKEALDMFIREHNPNTHGHGHGFTNSHSHSHVEASRSAYEVAVENFVHSCAGYLVATFVLGIGDRHNGNIMITKRGHLFHIDFGHFLGNFKSKFGINRERAAFVFTPEMAYVMGGKSSTQYKQFVALATQAFKVLRINVSLLELMFTLMVSAGMPELQTHDDIHYMREQLHLDALEAKAERKLTKEIDKSLSSTYRRVDNAIHNWKHGG